MPHRVRWLVVDAYPFRTHHKHTIATSTDWYEVDPLTLGARDYILDIRYVVVRGFVCLCVCVCPISVILAGSDPRMHTKKNWNPTPHHTTHPQQAGQGRAGHPQEDARDAGAHRVKALFLNIRYIGICTC